jgi:hypothetical protein
VQIGLTGLKSETYKHDKLLPGLRMYVSSQQLCAALDLVVAATAELVSDKTFHHAALTRLKQLNRPSDVKQLAEKIGKKASTAKRSSTGAGLNGLMLDERGKPSLEALVLHYAQRDRCLFSDAVVQAVRNKFAPARGPRYQGHWP